MNLVMNLLLVLQLLSAIAVIGLVLMQHGKGADAGAAFGGGSSASLFGATGGTNFMSRSTAVLATVFFACTLGLAYFGHQRPAASSSVLESVKTEAPMQAPAAPAAESKPATGAAQIPGQ
ncbi:MAG TPA: preprotein translocase subunit SecG [Macromonas sp.]|nr:preprotein translocase subunit SecG [Macromonas sp.]